MPARKKPKKAPKAPAKKAKKAKKAAPPKKKKTPPARKGALPKKAAAKGRPAKAKHAKTRVANKVKAAGPKTKGKAVGKPAARKPARTQPRARTTEDRVTPLVNAAPVSAMPFVEGFRPSRILTTRPRPVIRQIDPTGGIDEGPRTLQPWEIEVDDLAELMAVRAAEEKAAEEESAKLVSTPEAAKARIAEARAAGWVDDKRPGSPGLADARVRLVHPSCKFIDGKAVRDVSLSVHVGTGRATLLIEGGPRLRSASWRMREDEDLPAQIARLLDDPARLARAEHGSGQDLISALDLLDRTVAGDLRALVGRAPGAMTARLRQWVSDFAATHSAFGLPATVDAAWDRFGVRRGCVLERLGVAEEARRSVADAFDAALDSA